MNCYVHIWMRTLKSEPNPHFSQAIYCGCRDAHAYCVDLKKWFPFDFAPFDAAQDRQDKHRIAIRHHPFFCGRLVFMGISTTSLRSWWESGLNEKKGRTEHLALLRNDDYIKIGFDQQSFLEVIPFWRIEIIVTAATKIINQITRDW